MDWSYFNKFDAVSDKYLPAIGQGDTKATQIVTAVSKLVYKWYNDGDVYDNTGYMSGWCNDLSSYANWLRKHAGAGEILDRIYDCRTDEQYEDLLADLADMLLDEEILGFAETKAKEGSVYDCDGPYVFREEDEDDEWDDDVDETFYDPYSGCDMYE